MFSDNQAKKFVGKKWRIILLVTNFFCRRNFMPVFFSQWGIFAKCFIADGYVRALNMAQFLNMPGFWIYQSFKYASVINTPGFWICLWFWMCQASEYDRVTQDSKYVSISLLPEYPWECLTMLEYAGIFVNIPEATRMALLLHFPIIISCLKQHDPFSWSNKVWFFL